jgi:hypothetical protein
MSRFLYFYVNRLYRVILNNHLLLCILRLLRFSIILMTFIRSNYLTWNFRFLEHTQCIGAILILDIFSQHTYFIHTQTDHTLLARLQLVHPLKNFLLTTGSFCCGRRATRTTSGNEVRLRDRGAQWSWISKLLTVDLTARLFAVVFRSQGEARTQTMYGPLQTPQWLAYWLPVSTFMFSNGLFNSFLTRGDISTWNQSTFALKCYRWSVFIKY